MNSDSFTSVFVTFKEMKTQKGAVARIVLALEFMYCRCIKRIK
jgi:hypothetical protein